MATLKLEKFDSHAFVPSEEVNKATESTLGTLDLALESPMPLGLAVYAADEIGPCRFSSLTRSLRSGVIFHVVGIKCRSRARNST